jgi:electron transport complex protein RnfC
MTAAAEGTDVTVRTLKVRYPQGAEKQQIKTVLNREVPSGGLPMDVGVVVQNVATARAVYEAVRFRRPLIERALTVSGDAIGTPGNYWARVGTPISVLLEESGLSDDVERVILGGPMMGLAQYSTDVPVTRGTSGILAFKTPAEGSFESCIRCGKCVDACPAGLLPSLLSIIGEAERIDDAMAANVLDCIECGCCAYVCPAKRPIVQFVKYMKAELTKRKKAAQAEAKK